MMIAPRSLCARRGYAEMIARGNHDMQNEMQETHASAEDTLEMLAREQPTSELAERVVEN
jgi:hypothetical protein